MAEQVTFQDIDIYGREEASGKPYELFNEDAVKNALVLWITSKAGDFLLNPEAGGLLDRVLFKNMHGRSINLFTFALKNALYTEFFPAIRIIDFDIERDYQLKTLKISITYEISVSSSVQQLSFYTKDLIPIVEQKEQEVPYTDVNLQMFCIIRKPDMNNELLVYNEEEGSWRWGIYKFTNFSTEDSLYSEILEICNG